MFHCRLVIAVLLFSALIMSGCSSHSAPPRQGVYLSDGGHHLQLKETQGWPDMLGDPQKGTVPFFPFTTETQPHITIYLEDGQNTKVKLKSSRDDVDYNITYTSPDGKFYEIQPTKKLSGGPNCILLADSQTDKRHWCFSAGAVFAPWKAAPLDHGNCATQLFRTNLLSTRDTVDIEAFVG